MTDTKTKIVDFLNKTPEATAKKIAAGIKEEPTFVINALNALRTEAVVECEKRKGGGNELTYWLAKLVEAEDKMPEADPALLASANRMLSDRLHAVAIALREFGIPALESADGAGELQGCIRLAAASWREYREANNALGDLFSRIETQLINIEGHNVEYKIAKVCHDLIGAQNEINRLEADLISLQELKHLDHEEYKRELAALKEKAAIPDAPVIREKKQSQPRRPFSVTGLSGYHATSGKVTLFLDRRLSARSVTLPAEKLQRLLEIAEEAA